MELPEFRRVPVFWLSAIMEGIGPFSTNLPIVSV